MDGLKQINDTYGHHESSEALCRIAEIFKQSFRESDIIARIGGDEFTILATGTTSSNIPIPLDRVRENLSNYNSQKLYPYQFALSLSAIYVNPDDDSSIDELLARADEIIYAIKSKSDRRVLFENI